MKNLKTAIEKKLKQLRPGSLAMVLASRFDTSPEKFLLKHFPTIAKDAVKSGAAKLKDITKATVDFGKKSKTDDTGIDWEKVVIDGSTLQVGGLLLGPDAHKKLKAMEADMQKAVDKAKAKANKKAEKKQKQEAAKHDEDKKKDGK